jgi:hypothetical protein
MEVKLWLAPEGVIMVGVLPKLIIPIFDVHMHLLEKACLSIVHLRCSHISSML